MLSVEGEKIFRKRFRKIVSIVRKCFSSLNEFDRFFHKAINGELEHDYLSFDEAFSLFDSLDLDIGGPYEDVVPFPGTWQTFETYKESPDSDWSPACNWKLINDENGYVEGYSITRDEWHTLFRDIVELERQIFYDLDKHNYPILPGLVRSGLFGNGRRYAYGNTKKRSLYEPAKTLFF